MERRAKSDGHDYIDWQIRFAPSDAARHSSQTSLKYDVHALHHDRPCLPESGHASAIDFVPDHPDLNHSTIQESAHQNLPYAEWRALRVQSPVHRHTGQSQALNAPVDP